MKGYIDRFLLYFIDFIFNSTTHQLSLTERSTKPNALSPRDFSLRSVTMTDVNEDPDRPDEQQGDPPEQPQEGQDRSPAQDRDRHNQQNAPQG